MTVHALADAVDVITTTSRLRIGELLWEPGQTHPLTRVVELLPDGRCVTIPLRRATPVRHWTSAARHLGRRVR